MGMVVQITTCEYCEEMEEDYTEQHTFMVMAHNSIFIGCTMVRVCEMHAVEIRCYNQMARNTHNCNSVDIVQ